jgi:hypothetical protein
MDQADIRAAVRAELDERDHKREKAEARATWTADKSGVRRGGGDSARSEVAFFGSRGWRCQP